MAENRGLTGLTPITKPYLLLQSSHTQQSIGPIRSTYGLRYEPQQALTPHPVLDPSRSICSNPPRSQHEHTPICTVTPDIARR